MTDHPLPGPAPDSDEALAAYLAGDLDDAGAAAVEARLDDPAVAARLDALAATLTRLRGVDDVAPPDGYEQRLAERLRDARPRAGAAEGGTAAVSSLDEARARRRWTGAGAAAAALVLLAVGSFAVLRGMGGGDGAETAITMQDDAGDEAAGGQEARESLAAEGDAGVDAADAPEAVPAPPADGGGDAAVEESQAAPPTEEDAAVGAQPAPTVPPAAQAQEPGPPVVDDRPVPLSTDADVVAQLTDLPELTAVLGRPVDQAREDAAAAQRALALAPTVQGSPADDCVATSLAGYDPPVVVRVQAVTYAGQTASVYVVASSAGGEVLDRGTAVVVEPATCTTLATVPLAG